jgi:16S rRNA processing protein RimM
MQDFVDIGKIARPRGLHGEVWIDAISDDPARLSRLKCFYLETKRGRVELRVAKARVQDGRLVILFEEHQGRDAAERLRGKQLSIAREDMPELAEGEVFMTDLLGLRAHLQTGQFVGTVHDVLEMPAGWLLEIHQGELEALVPYRLEFIPDLDLKLGTITLSPLEGMLPEGMAVATETDSNED